MAKKKTKKSTSRKKTSRSAGARTKTSSGKTSSGKTSSSKAAASKSGARRGGPSRTWTLVTFAEMDGWRAERNIPKKKMADLVGVTNSTYHNWARGSAVATLNTQERIRNLLDSGGLAAEVRGASAGGGRAPDVLNATGQIVASYLAHKKREASLEELTRVVREVRRALEG
ncbi:MAG TPA: hypothetical protein DEA08_18590 [Planctomycetes bacterium]|nr:hypothetical protein [Planctomycetota bacterium]